jgi:hypothetical protein
MACAATQHEGVAWLRAVSAIAEAMQHVAEALELGLILLKTTPAGMGTGGHCHDCPMVGCKAGNPRPLKQPLHVWCLLVG